MSAFQKGHSLEEIVSVEDESLGGCYAISIDLKLSTFRMKQCLHIKGQTV